MSIYEIIGYVASVLVAVSLMMKNILKLRKLNLAGSLIFSLYGILIQAYPVFAVNFFIAIVNVYYLFQLYSRKDEFTLHAIDDPKNDYLKKFVDHYKDDIKKFFPEFDEKILIDSEIFFVLRNLIPVNLVVFRKTESETAFIYVDYAIPDYRDYKNAEFFYDKQKEFLKEKGFNKMKTKSNIPDHTKYLNKVGFSPSEKEPDLYIKKIG